MARVVVVEGPDSGNEYDLPAPAATGEGAAAGLVVGRDERAGVPLSDPAVSREHVRLEPNGGGFRLLDLGSRNQTFLNGEPVKDACLEDGDIIRVGDTELRFEASPAPAEAAGIRSTILKEIPARRRQESCVETLRLLAEAGDEERRRRTLASVRKLFDLYGEIAATGSPRELFEKLLAEVAPALAADAAAVLLREETGWVVRARYPAGDERQSGASSSIVEKAAEERKAILSARTRADERFRDKQSVIGEEIASALAAPILIGERAAAVLYADRRGGATPFTAEDLELLADAAAPAGALLERLEEKESLRRENRNLIRSLTEGKKIIGRSRAVREVLEFIRRAAPTAMTVLVEGETGTGKELVAAAIHYSSPRRGNPFVAINCAALPENLVESELFGHERGAFTGAVARRKGRFEQATTGTVFLDEVGELSLACQAKLLRLLEERKVERVGGTEPIPIDVRVIAATNRDLHGAVGEGSFREDLFYRLSVLNLRLPPLRERLEDIPLLAEHFLAGSATAKRLSKAAAEKLLSYSWPGNIRQLRNVLESAVVLGQGPEIEPEELVLPPAPRGRGGTPASSAPETAALAEAESWQPESLEALERRHIERVLKHTGGNKKRAAEILGIERCTLYAKIKSYGPAD